MDQRQRCCAPAEASEAGAGGAVRPPASPRYGGFPALARSPGKSLGSRSAPSPAASARSRAGASCPGEDSPWGTPASARGSSRLHSPLSSAGDAAAGGDADGGAGSARTPRRRTPERMSGCAGFGQGPGTPDPAAAGSFFGAPASSPPPRAAPGQQRPAGRQAPGRQGSPGLPAGFPAGQAAAEGRRRLAEPWLCRPETAGEGPWVAPPRFDGGSQAQPRAQRPPGDSSLGSLGGWGGGESAAGAHGEPPGQAPALSAAALSALAHGVWGAWQVQAPVDEDSHREGWHCNPGRAPGRHTWPQGRWPGQPPDSGAEAECVEGERAEGVWLRPPPPDACAEGVEMGCRAAYLPAYRRPMRRHASMYEHT